MSIALKILAGILFFAALYSLYIGVYYNFLGLLFVAIILYKFDEITHLKLCELRVYFSSKKKKDKEHLKEIDNQYQYILVEFTKGFPSPVKAYQEIKNGILLCYKDLEGRELALPAVTESRVINPNPTKPKWAI